MKSNEVIRKNLLDAREIVETAVSEKRSMTEEERNKAYNLYNEAKEGMDDAALQTKINQLEAEAIRGEEPVEKGAAYADLGSQFINSSEFKNWLKTVAPNGRIPDSVKGLNSPSFPVKMPLESKALVTGLSDTSAGAFIQNENSGEYGRLGYKEPGIRDLISVRQTESDAVDFVVQTAKITQAAAVAEATSAAAPTVVTTGAGDPLVYTSTVTPNAGGGYKPEGTITFERKTALVETIAVLLPVTKRAMSDASQLRGIINQELRDALNEEIEDMILEGSGTPQFDGIAGTTGILTQSFTTDLLTTSRKAITNLKTNGNEKPTAFVLSPSDWEGLELALFNAAPYLPYLKSLWRVPVVEYFGLTAKSGYLGNWKKAVIWDREEASISISGSHADFFARNLLAVLGEVRAAFGVIKPKAFVKIATAS